jgi:hypothetical protein
MHFTRFISSYCVTDWAIFNNATGALMLSSEIDLLMYSTFAAQSGEGARQQRLALALPYVLWWSNRAVIHLENDDSWTNPTQRWRFGRTREARVERLPYRGVKDLALTTS